MQVLRPLVDLVSRVPARVQAKLMAAFLAIAVLLIVMGAVGLQVLRPPENSAKNSMALQAGSPLARHRSRP